MTEQHLSDEERHQRRERLAAAALQGLLSRPTDSSGRVQFGDNHYVSRAVLFADLLADKLDSTPLSNGAGDRGPVSSA